MGACASQTAQDLKRKSIAFTSSLRTNDQRTRDPAARAAKAMGGDKPAGKTVGFAEPAKPKKAKEGMSSEEEAAIKERMKKRTSRSSNKKVEYDASGKARDSKRAEYAMSLALKAKRRGDIFVEHIEPKDRYSLAIIKKSSAQKQLIDDTLRANILFSDLNDDDLELMVMTMKSQAILAGSEIIQQGEFGDSYYVVESGTFEYVVDGEVVGTAAPTDGFGELALLYNAPRAATVRCVEDSNVWVLPRDNFRKIVASSVTKSSHEVKNALRSVPLLAGLNDAQLASLAEAVHTVRFEPGDTIIRKGDEGSVFYFIKYGSVSCTRIGSSDEALDLTLKQGDYFGERALLTKEPRAANVIATEDVEVMALDKDDFEKYMGDLSVLMDKNLGLRVLKSLPIMKDLSELERSKIVHEFKEKIFKRGEHIVRQGEAGSTFYIIREGEAEVSKVLENTDARTQITVLKNGDYFGEGSLLNDEPRGADVVASTDSVKCFELEREAFDRHLKKMKKTLSVKLTKRLDETDDKVKTTKRGIESQIKFHELRQLATLGTGTFGRVKLVEHKKLKMTFALKILQKAQVVAYKQQVNIINEKRVMEQADHPFVLRLFKTFKDKNCLYMLLELVPGGELFSLLHIHGGKLGDKDARFYAACVLDGLEYLHDRSIVYRDLKPENLLIDAEGYIKIVDFGFAKKVTDKTFTLCGTPEYLSPELVLGIGHNKGVDYWALGILIYEMITGASPFADHEGGDHLVICSKIVRMRLEFPRKYPEKAKELTSQLLVRESHLRLGCLAGGALDIKEDPWFDTLDWTELYRKRIKAPWIPEIKDALDTSHFDAYEEDDEVEEYKPTGSNWDADF